MGPFEEAGGQLISGAIIGMYLTAREIMAASLEIAPVDTGTLRGSAKIEPVEQGDVSIRVRFGYGYGDEINPKTGRPAADYAVPVHEIIEAYHPPPTQAKFLEDPVMELAPALARNMEASMQLIAKRGNVIISGRVKQLLSPEPIPVSTLFSG